jgi:hypothetical protein
MAYTRTFAQLSLAVQQAGAWENSDDITADVLLQAINYALLKGYGYMVKAWEDYYTIDTTFAIVAGTASYALATIAPNFYKLRHLDVSADGVTFKRIRPHALDAAYRYTGLSPASSIFRMRYRMQGANLVFAPTPPAGTARIYWIPLPVQFASIADVTPVTFDVPEEEMLVVALGQKFCLKRSDLDESQIDKDIGEYVGGLRCEADNRDAGEPFYLDPGGPPVDDDCEGWY